MVNFISADTPPRPMPLNDSSVSDRVHMLREVVERAKQLLSAQIATEKACDVRGALGGGSSRAKITSANAKWMSAAEQRDRCEQNLVYALEASGLALNDEQGTKVKMLWVALQSVLSSPAWAHSPACECPTCNCVRAAIARATAPALTPAQLDAVQEDINMGR